MVMTTTIMIIITHYFYYSGSDGYEEAVSDNDDIDLINDECLYEHVFRMSSFKIYFSVS